MGLTLRFGESGAVAPAELLLEGPATGASEAGASVPPVSVAALRRYMCIGRAVMFCSFQGRLLPRIGIS